MSDDRARWDAKHRADAHSAPADPDPWIASVLESMLEDRPAPGRALDLACGRGRHALVLARRGFAVEGWDVSPVALRLLRDAARREGLEVATRLVDLARGLPQDAPRFDLVLVVRFLDRKLYPELHRLIAPGGELLLTTFTRDWPKASPSARFRLARGELAEGLPGLETVAYEERGGLARLRSRAPGVN